MKKSKHPIPNFSMYDGETQIIYECPGDCKLARFFVEPPEPTDNCMLIGDGMSCRNPAARLAAAEALRKVIEKEIEELKEGFE